MATTLSTTRKNDENLETYCLVWLDGEVNNSEENIQAQQYLRTSINHLVTFQDDQQCLEYIKSIPKDDRIVLIVSGRLGQIIVPKIVQLRQITSIYVYCMNKQANEQWAKKFSKVKAVIIDLNELISQIRTDQNQRKHNQIDEPLSIYMINTSEGNHGQSTSELGGDFIHSQLLINCLIQMESTINDKDEFLSLCKQQYQGNSNALEIVKEFERDYSSNRALWWYTRDSFLYQILNKALRMQNIDLLFLLRCFIRDIEQQLEKNKCSTPVRVYRSQLMSNDEVQILKNSLGEFTSFNSFLSTSFNRQKARSFFSLSDITIGSERVFFEIDADPRLENIKPFSDISLHSYYPEENEVLFMIGSIFRLVNINRDQDGILNITMKLCSNNDHHFKALFERMQNRYNGGKTNPIKFCYMLEGMGKWDDAEKYLHRLLKELPDNHNDIAQCYQRLGNVAERKSDYESSLNWHKKSLEIKIRTLKGDHISIADSHNNIGFLFIQIKEYTRALESLNKALMIYKRAYGEDHTQVAACLGNMGIVYLRENKLSEALDLYQKALSIQEKHLTADHADLGISHNNIGIIHQRLGQYDLALSHYNLTLKIHKKCHPSQHPDIGSTLANVGLVYETQRDMQQALSYYEKALTIYRHSLSPTHRDVVKTENDIRRVSSKLN